VPGYAIIGVVDAIGDDITSAAVGDRAAALTIHGSYAEYFFLGENQLISIPPPWTRWKLHRLS
jgi:NADPH2:quinone reductase